LLPSITDFLRLITNLATQHVEKTIWDWIEERASSHADAPVLLDTSSVAKMSFVELAEQISALRLEFRKLGIGRDTKVAMSLKDGPETLVILLSLMSIASVLPIHPTAAAASFDAHVEQLGISGVVGGNRPASAAWKTALYPDFGNNGPVVDRRYYPAQFRPQYRDTWHFERLGRWISVCCSLLWT